MVWYFQTKTNRTMEKIFIACMACMTVLFAARVFFDTFNSFQARVLYFILVLNEHGSHDFMSLFISETETVTDFVSNKPGFPAQMISSFFKKEIRSLLEETEGFDRETRFFKDNSEYQKANEANELRNANIAKLYIALGNPQI